MEEEFRIIKGFENYSVSNLGNVKINKSGRMIKCYNNAYGYLLVSMKNMNGIFKMSQIHRLVASAFIPNPENKRCVDHINNIRNDNNLINLRWATHQENSFNAGISSKNTSGNKGVFYHKRDKIWYSTIRINGAKHHIGNFSSKEEAIKARVKKAKEIYGEFINNCELIHDEIKELKEQKLKELKQLEELEKEFENIINIEQFKNNIKTI